MSVFALPALAVPADPNRPLTAQSCGVAQVRLAEARAGSPLLSPDEQAQVLRVALSDVARLCGSGQRDGRFTDPYAPLRFQNTDAERIHPRQSLAPPPAFPEMSGTVRRFS